VGRGDAPDSFPRSGPGTALFLRRIVTMLESFYVRVAPFGLVLRMT